ncbi:MAG: helix-turn-helix domain-containing protein [Oscillospiraceae bacterium]|nr:helix-turn-helix domain-containing protein [Oscillospiraceae bacterium]
MFHIERDAHHSNYTCISNDIIMDKRLSLAARGFFTAVLSLPDDWDFSVNGMARLVGVNKDTALRYIRELEELGYVRIESKDEIGRYARKSYTFFESTVPQNTAPQRSAEEDTVPKNTAPQRSAEEDTVPQNTVLQYSADDDEVTENTAPKITVPKNTAQSNTNILNTKYKQNTISIDQDDEQNNFSYLEKQINGEILREEFGGYYIDKVVEVITDCMKAKSRTISGDTVDNSELQRVFGEVCEEDIRKATQALKGKRYDNFAGYFGSVLFNQIKSRIERPQLQPRNDYSSLDIQSIEEDIMAKYRRCDTVSQVAL